MEAAIDNPARRFKLYDTLRLEIRITFHLKNAGYTFLAFCPYFLPD